MDIDFAKPSLAKKLLDHFRRLAWSPTVTYSASTFLRQSIRLIRRQGYNDGLIVTYAMPNTSGIIYERAGFKHCGFSSGSAWSRRGKEERATPDTIGKNTKLKRFFYSLEK